MHIEQLRKYCLLKPGAQESFPFDEHTLVFKVGGKIFAITSLNELECKVNLKCEPERAVELREKHPEIVPGWHMNKQHWNTVHCEGDLPDDFIEALIDHSYDLIIAGLPKQVRKQIDNK